MFPIRSFLCLLISISTIIPGFSQDFTVESYTVDVAINEAGYFEVTETYDVDFAVYKHGIYRDIQTTYDLLTEYGSTEKRKIRITDVEVPGHMFEASGRIGQNIEGRIRIKIGDPNKTVRGPVHYEIRYRVENAFLYEESATRFYWNLKPPDWNAPFNKISFSLRLPEGLSADRNDLNLYTGPVGTSTPTEDFKIELAGNTVTGSSDAEFISQAGESVTVLLNLPVGSIAEKKPFWPFWSDYGWLLILGMFAAFYYRLFRKFGKDDPAPAAISYFPPGNMNPAMVGFLMNDKGDSNDLISLLPYWGYHGLIEIEEIDKDGWFSKDDTSIRKLKELPVDAPDYEKVVFRGLFKDGQEEVMVSSLKNTFYTTMNEAKGELKDAAQVYYDKTSRKMYIRSAWGIVLGSLLVLPLFLYIWGLAALFSGLILAVLLLILNRYMVKKNPMGIRLFSELKGFKKFIKTAEINRLKMLLEQSPDYFESTMAYAVTFGSLQSWAEKFESFEIPPPTWYHTTAGTHMSLNHFSKSFSSTLNTTTTTMVSSPSSSSSGGGSSGGGFGGGGGGSW